MKTSTPETRPLGRLSDPLWIKDGGKNNTAKNLLNIGTTTGAISASCHYILA